MAIVERNEIMEGALYLCRERVIVDDNNVLIPGNKNEIIPREFAENRRIQEVVIPNTIEKIGYNAFGGCENLVRVIIPGSVKTIDDRAFKKCYKLYDIIIEEGLEKIGSNVFERTLIKELKLPNSVKEISSKAFAGSSLTTVWLKEDIAEKLICDFSDKENSYKDISFFTFDKDDNLVRYTRNKAAYKTVYIEDENTRLQRRYHFDRKAGEWILKGEKVKDISRDDENQK